MKKLMIAAAIAFAAVCANAASIKWSCVGFSALPDKTAASTAMTAYWLDGSTWTAFGLLEASEVAAYARANGTAGTTALSRGAYTATGSYGDYAAGQAVSGYLVVLSTDSDKASYYSASSSLFSGNMPPAAGSNLSKSFAFSTDTTGWTSTKDPEPTPEPTSAMLMLLGVAGLALKRKRA